MPGSNEDYSNFLDSQAKTAAEQAAKKGTPINTREQVLTGLAGRFQNDHEVLTYVSQVNAKDVDRKTELQNKANLQQNEREELDKIDARLAGGHTITKDVLNKLNEEREERIQGYYGEDFGELGKKVRGLNGNVEDKKRELDQAKRDYRGEPDKIRQFEDRLRTAQSRLDEAKGVYDRRAPEESQKLKEDQAEQAENDRQDRLEKYRSSSLDELRQESTKHYTEWNKLNADTNKINRRGTPEQKAEHRAKLAKSAQSWKEANDILLEKEKDEEKKTTVAAEKSRRDTATVPELTATRNAAQDEVTRLRDELANSDYQLNLRKNSGARPDELAKAFQERNKIASQLGEANTRLADENTALQAAEDRARRETGSSDVPTLANIEHESVGEYLGSSVENRKDHLRAVSEVLPDGAYNFDTVNALAEAGAPLTIEQRAFMAREVTNRLLDGNGYDARNLPQLAAQYPEVFNLISDKVMASKAAEAFRRENFPTGWEKMLDFAKKYPQVMAILIALIASGVAVAGSGGILPAIGGALA